LYGKGEVTLYSSAAFYKALFKVKKEDIATENTFFWDIEIE